MIQGKLSLISVWRLCWNLKILYVDCTSIQETQKLVYRLLAYYRSFIKFTCKLRIKKVSWKLVLVWFTNLLNIKNRSCFRKKMTQTPVYIFLIFNLLPYLNFWFEIGFHFVFFFPFAPSQIWVSISSKVQTHDFALSCKKIDRRIIVS